LAITVAIHPVDATPFLISVPLAAIPPRKKTWRMENGAAKKIRARNPKATRRIAPI
jgi:hypothetical protein